MSIETRNLEYDEITGMVWLKPHATEDNDSVCLGAPGDWRLCPDEYVDEMDRLIGLIEDDERYGDACERTASEAYEWGQP